MGGKYMLRNIAGNKGGMGGRYCTIMYSIMPLFCVENAFFQHLSTPPKSDPC